jgi:hypothetical protein
MRKFLSLIALACAAGLTGCCHDTCDCCRDICSGCGPHGAHMSPGGGCCGGGTGGPVGGPMGGPVGGPVVIQPGPGGAAPMPAPTPK